MFNNSKSRTRNNFFEVNSESLVTVTAESQLDLTTNYATTSITVAADQTDFDPPECHLTRYSVKINYMICALN